jgi:hypothetical protein
MRESKRSLYEEADPAQRAHDPTSAIFELAKQLALAGAAGGGPEGASAGVVRVAELEVAALPPFSPLSILDAPPPPLPSRPPPSPPVPSPPLPSPTHRHEHALPPSRSSLI